MNVALVLAGGVGRRMGAGVPKQFIEVLGKPVIVHTLEVFENSPSIDAIEVACVESYIGDVWAYKEKFGITKLRWVVPGGDICQDTIRNGVFALEGICSPDDIILMAMSVVPLIDEAVIKDSLRVCKEHGNAVAGDYSIYNLCKVENGVMESREYVLKEEHVTLNLPWTWPFGKLLWAYKEAYSRNIGTDVRSYTTTLMIDLGEKLYFSKDTQKNKLKLTTFDDVDMLEGYLLVRQLREQKEKEKEK